MSDNLKKVYSLVEASKNGTTVKRISEITDIPERTVYNCLKELGIQRRVYKDLVTGFYRNTLLSLRGYQPRKCHGLMQRFHEYMGQTVLQNFIEYANENHPDILLNRELKIKPNTHSTLDFSTTDNPLSSKALETWEQINESYFGDIDWSYSKFTYNIDTTLCILEPSAVTVKESHRLLRFYNHPYKNGVPSLRFEVEKSKVSREEAIKYLLYQADVDYLLDVIFQKDRAIDALNRQLIKERIASQREIKHLKEKLEKWEAAI
jgi:hypothetical protein